MSLTQKYRRIFFVLSLILICLVPLRSLAVIDENLPQESENKKTVKQQTVAALTHEESIVAQTFSYQSEYVFAQNEKIGKQCDKIIKSLEKRYGKPKIWKKFPVFFSTSPGGSVAGYTSYIYPSVAKVVVYQSFEIANGGTLDHELTHAFFFYYFQSSFDLFLNEGLAQNSEYKRRQALRSIVYRRYSNGEFWTLDKLYGRNSYDGSLLMYHESFSVVDFLIARGGAKWFVLFVDDLTNHTKNIDVCLKKYYEYQNLKDFENEWIQYIENGQDRKKVKPIF